MIQKMKQRFYRGWQEGEHITAFATRLDREQKELARQKVIITNDDQLQHYILEMYDSNQFDRKELTDWEKKDEYNKTWDEATEYFEDIVADIDAYDENRGGTAKKARFESAANMAEKEAEEQVGREICDYIEGLASRSEQDKETMAQLTAQTESLNAIQATLKVQLAAKDETIKQLTAQVKTLTDSIATLTKSFAGDDGSRKRKKTGPATRPAIKCEACTENCPPWLLKMANMNMGGYCWTCGHNPIGKGHTSKSWAQVRRHRSQQDGWQRGEQAHRHVTTAGAMG